MYPTLNQLFFFFLQGYDTMIKENGLGVLNFVQQIKLGIARAVYKKPAILLFDDITKNLDTWDDILV